MLAKEYNWKWYGGHHLENRMSTFYHTYFIPRRFGIDQRTNGFSALVRSGQITRKEGYDLIKKAPVADPELIEMVTNVGI